MCHSRDIIVMRIITDSSKYCPDFPERLVVKIKDAEKYSGNEDIKAAFCSRAMAIKLLSLDFPNLKTIQLFSAGYDGIDLELVRKKGITLCNAANVYNLGMAEFVVYAMLRRAKRYHRSIKNLCLRPLRNYHYITELRGKTVGIMGCGNIGQQVAKCLSGFEMTVIGYDAFPGDKPFFENIYGPDEKNVFVPQCDYIVNIIPLMPSNARMLDKSWCELMKSDVTFVNVARKGTINDADLIAFLKTHKYATAILDMLEMMPNPITNPYRRLDNVLVLPGVTAASVESRGRLHKLLLTNLDNIRNGTELLNIITK